MKQQDQRAPYTPPSVTELGKVSVVTAALGMTFTTDSAFTGSMER